MDTFVTVLTVQYPQQLWIIKGRLESEGIQCFVKDELTVQAYNLYSNAVGGVKLQVLKEDAEKATELLKELGYIKEESVSPDLLSRIDAKTAALPLLKNVNVVNRIIILVLLSVMLITALLYFIFKPPLAELLTQNSWCVDKIEYNSKTVEAKTTGFLVRLVNRNGDATCREQITLDKDHTLSLPGINSNSISGYWKLDEDDNIKITTNSYKNIFAGTYKADISNKGLILKSKTTVIYAHKDNLHFSLPF